MYKVSEEAEKAARNALANGLPTMSGFEKLGPESRAAVLLVVLFHRGLVTKAGEVQGLSGAVSSLWPSAPQRKLKYIAERFRQFLIAARLSTVRGRGRHTLTTLTLPKELRALIDQAGEDSPLEPDDEQMPKQGEELDTPETPEEVDATALVRIEEALEHELGELRAQYDRAVGETREKYGAMMEAVRKLGARGSHDMASNLLNLI